MLFKDTISGNLFNLELTQSNEDKKLIDLIANKRLNKEELTIEERIQDFKRQMKTGNKYQFPNSVGITGQVYKSQQMVWT